MEVLLEVCRFGRRTKCIAPSRTVHSAGVPVLYHPSYINFCGSFANDSAWLQNGITILAL
ncbi:MAG: hypothetical protein IPG70_12430 [Moraxellaceae bacterium]|nr:hypothetical protein [Moraxellaceae bacterium]